MTIYINVQKEHDLHYIHSALSPYDHDKHFYIGYYTVQKQPNIIYYNCYDEPMTDK